MLFLSSQFFIFRIINEQNCGFLLVGHWWYLSYSWHFLPEYLSSHRWQPKDISHQQLHAWRSPPKCRNWEKCISYFQSFWKWSSNRSSTTLLCSAQIFPSLSRIQDGTAFCSVTANMGTKIIDAAIDHFLTFLTNWEFPVTVTNKKNQNRCIIFPNDNADGESSTKCTHRQAPNSLM